MATTRERPRDAAAAPRPTRPSRERALLLLVAVALALAAAAGWRLRGGGPAVAERGPVHVHGLGVNPADGALFVATHTGLFRAAPGERKAARVGDSRQDTMGFTVVGPDRFLGSGHPDARAALPPLLGLLESRDGGRTWRPVSLLGEADFHVLRYAGTRLYGYDVTGERLLVSRDHGRTWEERELPGPLLDLAVDPADPSRLLAVAAGPAGDGTYESRDGGRSWTYASEMVGLLAWPAPGRLYVADAGGVVSLSSDRGRTFERRGAVGGEPAALLAHSGELYAALHDGTIVRSRDGGRTWSVRSEP